MGSEMCIRDRLMTYAAGLDAVTIVWIAERFSDEHRAALDWLNEITGEKVGFFRLEADRALFGPPSTNGYGSRSRVSTRYSGTA